MNEDAQAGFAWYKKAADGGLPEAKLHLGDSFQFGRGINSDMDKAFELYTEAAELGDADAMYILGAHYLETARLEFDLYMKGIDWLTKAAKAGHEGAQFELTEMGIDWNK